MTLTKPAFCSLPSVQISRLPSGVSVTAYAVGFNSESAFIERFKQATGMTPGRYQRKA
ncbi:helix-turn-helix domain-containing protein [Parendozoicomonas haliclonae]|uniref:helix-turn-helix domain-containing protein n=1 Tax=Parendozoicomonas haliclonae TaxID=1960125 RepID=UPI000B3626A5